MPKTKKIVFDATLLKTPYYKVRVKGKVELTREWSGSLSYISLLEQLKKEPLSTKLVNFRAYISKRFKFQLE